MILAVLVIVILTLLGVSFLLMADLENRIAENEVFSSQALYFAEAAARATIQWFDHPLPPASAANAWPLDPGVADRTQRIIDEDGAGPAPQHPQDGADWPRYKQGIDANGDGEDDLFDRPYRKDRKNTLLGTENGPDVRIRADASTAAKDFLDAMSEGLMAGYPNGAAGVHARIVAIDVYGPPYLLVGGNWVRYGIGTVRVVARIERTGFGTPQVLAERVVKFVLNEIPYSLPYGALHSCGGTNVTNGFPAAWGAFSESQGATLPPHEQIPASLARDVSPSVRNDLLLWSTDDATFASYAAALSTSPEPPIEDPWLRFVAGGLIAGWPPATQPRPFNWVAGAPLGSGTQPNHAGGVEGSHSNLLHSMPLAGCVALDYELWKSVATSGRDGVEYYTWDSGDLFRRDGTGPPRAFADVTDVNAALPSSRPALFFFDTRDRRAPHDDDADGRYDNLTPDIAIAGGTWSPRGFLFLNSESVRAAGVFGRSATVRAPGEPFQDRDQNGVYDTGEGYINLAYPTSFPGQILASAADDLHDDGTSGSGVPERNAYGPPITTDIISLWGILATTGKYDASGPANHFGSIWAIGGVEQSNPSQPAAKVYWDDSIRRQQWPPADWPLPRVTATRWQTDL